MDDPKPLMPGEPCPNCTGELRPAPVPTDEQYARAHDRDNPVALDRRFDSATKAQRDDLGALYRCTECGYVTRFKEPVAAGDGAGKPKKK